MTDIKVLGNRDENLKKVEFGRNFEEFTVSEAVQVSTDRAASTYQVFKDLKKDDVVELIFEDDIHRWVTVEELERDYKYQLSRGQEADVFEIPARLPTGDVSRGATTLALKALRVLKFDPVKEAADKFAEFWDSRLMKAPGLYRFDKGLDKPSPEIKQLQLKEKKPILLFIHGTFSSTAGGFGGMYPEVWKALQQEYGDRIFGYDHRTLSLSPVENALDLVGKLPNGVKLHLVTHSRGGLVGELLCRGGRKDKKEPFDKDDVKLLSENEAVAEALTRLSGLLAKKKITVERFVRVACPARGTALISKKLDRWLEIIVNVIGKLLPPGAAEPYGVITDLLLDFKKQAADPEAMPGLASMVPESNFIKMINRLDVELDVDLSVIAGDIEKNDVIGRLAVFFADLFYMQEHDLVVQTPAMYGGPTRRDGRYFFLKGPGVHHSSYFSNKRTAEVIREALTGSTGKLTAKGFRPITEAYVRAVPELELGTRSFQKRSNLTQPVVYIVPGIMGTHLAEGGRRIWLDILDLAQGRMANLKITNKKVQPEALVALAYANLVEYLSATHEVIPFPYDWRLSILEEAERFANALEAKLKETKADQPIRIVAHSMGGLVTRAMISLRPQLWKRIRERDGSRFIMLGTPNRGSYQIPRLILGQEKTFRMLAMLDLRNSAQQLLDIISRFPGVLQLLPMDQDGKWNFLEAATWDKFPNTGRMRWVKPQAKDLEQARKFQAFLEAGKKDIGDWNSVVYVAGCGRGAPIGMDLGGRQDINFLGTNRGDGTVPWETGILPELTNNTYYMDVPHGDLANHKEDFAALYDLLNEGATTRLLKTPPRFDRGQEDHYLLRDEGVEIYPSQLDLETTVLGASPIHHQASAVKPVQVSVVHGNLSFCSNAVAVGHYEGDGLYSAEKDLDHHLSGRLSARHSLGLYPGPEGTVEVVLNENDRKPGGAIIVGLGKAGELSPHKLSNSYANALREFGIKAVENGIVGEDGELKVSTLLIGAGGNGLSVANSVDAILSAVLQANRSFSQMADSQKGNSRLRYNLRISEVQFVELFKDQAILAAKALRPFRENEAFSVTLKLQSLRGGWKRIAYEEPPGWWNRIYVRAGEKEDGSLIFSVPTDRARSEESRLGVQRRNMDRLIAQAVKNPNWDQNLATALFELMVPNRIKGSFKDMNNVLFVLDEEGARYPWELFYDRRSGQDLPLVVQAGMIRQFSTFTFQERVVDVRNRNVMVVGNPANTPANFSNLPGAEQEASLVASKLEANGFTVQAAIHTDSDHIMSQLFSKDYRVLHLAGHGVYEYEYKASEKAKPEVYTGMVLGNGVFLTANEIRNKMSIPELVFINCCHLGKLSSDREEGQDPAYAFNEFAASLSKALIEMGVKAVIAAGWAVDDAAALTFAEVFYERLLNGDRFGSAVKAARVETFRLHKDRTNTWGAYQCYGDPDYRLVTKTDNDPSRRERFVDVDEAIVKVNQQYEKAKTASAQGIEKIRVDLQNLSEGLERDNREWMNNPRLLEALGEAFGEAFWFEEAVRCYDLAVKNGNSTTIKAVEQSVNCHIRLALQEYENKSMTYEAARAEIETQIKKLEQLMDMIGQTSERLSMVGSGYKRLAQIAADRSQAACNSALKKMEAAYKQASQKKEDAYPLTNYVTAMVVQLLRTGDRDPGRISEIKKFIDDARAIAEKEKLNSPDDFWAKIGVTEVRLVEHLHGRLGEKRRASSQKLHDGVLAEYATAWKQYGSARELNSIIEHYAFLVKVLKEIEAQKDLCEELEKILNSLRSMYEEGG